MSGFIAGAAKIYKGRSNVSRSILSLRDVIMVLRIMRINQRRKKAIAAGLALLGIDVAYFGVSNPGGASPLVVIIGSVLVLVTLYAFVSVVVAVATMFVPMKAITRKRLVGFSTLVLAFLILMQSIGQLGWRDVLAALPLFVVAYLYITYNSENGVKSEGQGL